MYFVGIGKLITIPNFMGGKLFNKCAYERVI